MMNINELLKTLKGISQSYPPYAYAIAVWNDYLIAEGAKPLNKKEWDRVATQSKLSGSEQKLLEDNGHRGAFFESHMCLVTHWALELKLPFPKKTKAFAAQPGEALIIQFFKSIRAIPPELLQSSVFRQEEVLRRWAEIFSVEIEGEDSKSSEAKLKTLDYLRTLNDAREAQGVLESTIKQRERVLAHLKAQNTQSRGSYE